jgi:chemosensory pili system protein ChpA (sensor histidine kinase/response regulator)
VRADWVDRMVNQAGEVAIARSRIESEVFAFKRHVTELSEALTRLRGHIREVEIQAESQMQATFLSQGRCRKIRSAGIRPLHPLPGSHPFPG